MNLSAFLTFSYLSSPDPCEAGEFSSSGAKDWKLDYGS